MTKLSIIHCILICFSMIKTIDCRQATYHHSEVTAKPTPQTTVGSDWTIMIYMGARNNLAPFAASNLQDMATNATNNQVNVVVQWDQSGKKGAWRYIAKMGQATLEQYINVTNPTDIGQNLIDFCSWSAENFPAKKYCLVLWNHGTGALDPIFNDPLRIFLQNRDLLLDQQNHFSFDKFVKECNQPNTFGQESTNEDFINRGILFDDEYKTYLSNIDLRRALSTITSSAVLNKKIDCLGFDACYMSMIEVAYQVKDYAKFMIASEELELAKGWNYGYFISQLCNNPSKQAKEVAQDIVKGFEHFYKGKTQLYTQAAIDLSKISSIKDNHDNIITTLELVAKQYKQRLVNALLKARKATLQFSAKFYVDLHSLYKTIANKILTEDVIAPKNVDKDKDLFIYDSHYLRSKQYSNNIISLVDLLKNGMRLIETAVVEQTNSSQFVEAKGLSIYFPSSRAIDNSYENTEFVKRSPWLRFLQYICEFF